MKIVAVAFEMLTSFKLLFGDILGHRLKLTFIECLLFASNLLRHVIYFK